MLVDIPEEFVEDFMQMLINQLSELHLDGRLWGAREIK